MANIKRTKETVATDLRKLAEEGCPMTSTHVPMGLVMSARGYYGSWKKAISELGLKQTRKAYVETPDIRRGYEGRRRWTDAVISKALREASALGLTPTEFRSSHSQMGDAIDRRFGGVLQACDHFKIVRLPRENIDPYKNAGYSFEHVLGEILSDLGFIYESQKKVGNCIPDFQIGRTWYDAKLSEWTIHCCDTVKKYEPICDELVIVFLRGDHSTNKHISDKTRLVHVSYLLARLPEILRRSYEKKLDSILVELDSCLTSKAA